jgi:putative transposase
LYTASSITSAPRYHPACDAERGEAGPQSFSRALPLKGGHRLTASLAAHRDLASRPATANVQGGPRGYDAAKKIKGRKRPVAVDTLGLLLGVIVHAADIQDADSAWDLLKQVKHLYCWLKVVFADSIYDRSAVLIACFLLGLTLILVRRIAGTTGFVVLPKRWIVERTLGWLGRCRRLSKDYEELPEVSEAMVTLAMIRLMLHRLVHPNRKRLPAP